MKASKTINYQTTKLTDMKDTNTHENLLLIYQAMSAIDKNDRSLYFLNYYKEVQERIRELYELSKHGKKIFKIYQEGEKQIIERLSYPRFKGIVTFSGNLSDIEDIEVDEEILDAGDIATALREAADFLINSKKST